MPANGGNRWRLSRWLAGGFHSYWLLRCTVSQLAVAGQKLLVPFIAFSLLLTDYQWICYLSIVKLTAYNCHTLALLNATTVELVLLSPNTPILPEISVVLLTPSIYCPLM